MAQEDMYIVDVETNRRLAFQNIPDTLTIQRQIQSGEVVVAGMNNPLTHYTSGTDTISFKLSFYSEQENRRDVRDKINFLRSLGYNNGYLTERPRILLVWGNFFEDETWYLSSFKADAELFNKAVGKLPQLGYADLTLTYQPSEQIIINDVR